MKRYLVAAAAVLTFCFMSDSDKVEAQRELQAYCDRVDIWHASADPEDTQSLRRSQDLLNVSGHPDYHGIYESQCGGLYVE